MKTSETFQRRGIVEGFVGPLWSMAHHKALFEFGAARGMNTYLYAPALSCERIHEEKLSKNSESHLHTQQSEKKVSKEKTRILTQQKQNRDFH